MEQTKSLLSSAILSRSYAFVSYSHDDTKQVLEYLNVLYRSGIRFWYDKGIPLTSDWLNEIASKISDCSLFISFISSKSITSEVCDLEIIHAFTMHKKILYIILDKTELPPKYIMLTASKQCIYAFDKPFKFQIDQITSWISQNIPELIETIERFGVNPEDRYIPDRKRFITVLDENGVECEMEIISAFTLKSTNKDYVLYTDGKIDPVSDTCVIFASILNEEKGVYSLAAIESDQEWEEVKKVMDDISKSTDD